MYNAEKTSDIRSMPSSRTSVAGTPLLSLRLRFSWLGPSPLINPPLGATKEQMAEALGVEYLL